MKGVISYIGIIFIVFTGACGNNKEGNIYDTPEKGLIRISVDESFKPVISEQIKVYESTFPKAKIVASYKSEADCLRDLGSDSTRMVIVAKGLTDEEGKSFEKNLKFKPQWDVLAYDAVSVIVNIASKDSVFTMERIKKFLTDSVDKEIIVDGRNATSTVRFLLDSVLKGESFSRGVKAVEGSKEVVDFVANNTNAVGFVGSSWVGNEQDPEQLKYNDKIRLALLECKVCSSDTFAKPSQATITYGQYPLVRPLYYILKEHTTGLGTGFVNFMSLERGQLIFRRSYLVPAKMYFGIRKVI